MALLTLVVLGAGVPAAASAPDHRRGAEALWQTYPLYPDEPTSEVGAARARAPASEAPDPAPNTRLTLQLAMLLAVVYAGFVCVWVTMIHPRRRRQHHPVGSAGAHAEAVWTCEIGWRAGRVRSRFRACVAGPDGRRRHVIAESRHVRWPPKRGDDAATAELVAALDSLVAALVAAGWEPVEPARSWSARRFIWRRGGQPSGRPRLAREE